MKINLSHAICVLLRVFFLLLLLFFLLRQTIRQIYGSVQ